MIRFGKNKHRLPKLRRIVGVALALALVATGIGITAVQAQGQPKTGLVVSPATFELSANPGDTLKNSLRVDNSSDEPLQLSTETRNFSALGEEGGINLSAEETRYSLTSWITVSPNSVVIPPKESRTFEYVINVPSFAEPGGRFGSIVFKTPAKAVNGQTNVALAQEVGALVFIKIAGQVNEKASVSSFVPAHKFNEYGPINFDIRVKNEGNVQFKPKGTITISNFFGRKVATIPVDAQNVLPDAVRKMKAEWKNKWLFGNYTATASLVYGNDNKIVTASTTFWGFPYRIMAVSAIALAGIGFVVYRRRARLGRAFKVLFGKD
jgi:hypothetical protein